MSQTQKPNDNSQGKDREKKKVTIYVNSSAEQVEKDEISYEEVVTLAFPDFPQHPERNYSVKYVRGQGNKPEGILSPGGKVKVKDGMEFTVTPTGQS
ncbi:MAG: multiubiquitin domain-containing protein [Chitinophagales bacterium]|nr:multiubiquitin domain-containing protein [Chitinophagales bacterium]